MRIATTVLLALVLVVGVTIAAFAGLDLLQGPRSETVDGVTPLRNPAALPIDPSPLDHENLRIDPIVVDAGHRTRFTLAGNVRPGSTRRILLVSKTRKGRLTRATTTDDAGYFEIRDLLRGRYALRVYGGHYPIERDLQIDADRALDLTDAELRQELSVSFPGTPPQPVQKAFVMLTLKGAVVARGSTDSLGNVVLDGVPKGKLGWTVWANHTDQPTGSKEWQDRKSTRLNSSHT